MIRSNRRAAQVEVPELELSEMEERLRGCAPGLPPTLRNRMLESCRVRAEAHRRRQKRLQWQLAGTVAGVLAVQWMTLFVVEAQNTQLIAGDSKPPLFASLSFDDISQLWHQRSRELARLMEPPNTG